MLRSFLRFLLENRLLELSGHLVLWPLMGALAGALVGVWAYRFVRSRGGFRLEGWGGRGWRGLACAGIVAAFTAGGTYVGVCEGLWRGVRAAFAEGTLVSDVVTSLGQVEALLLAGLYHGARGVSEHPGITPGDEARLVGEGVDAFISGREELSVGDLRRQLGTIGAEVVDQAAVVVEEKILVLLPVLREPGRRFLLHRVLTGLGGELARKPVSASLKHLRLEGYLDRILAGLPAEAARRGTVDGISFAELSDYLGRTSLATWILDAVRGFLRTQQALAGAAVLGFLGLVAGLFGLVRAIQGRIGRSCQGDPKGSIST